MGLIDKYKEKIGAYFQSKPENVQPVEKEIVAYSGYRTLFTVDFDGEKNTGELGPRIKYNMDHFGLLTRSWKSYADNEISKTVIGKYVKWIVGSGLKLQSEPEISILNENGIDINLEEFTKKVEAKFKLFAKRKDVDYTRRRSLNKLAKEAYKYSKVGGDCLVIMRVEKRGLTVQLVDGELVQNPFDLESIRQIESSGNSINNGVEINSRGEVVAFWVKEIDLSYKRIASRGKKTDREMAFMLYGSEHRENDYRGVPITSTVLETLSKLDRYKEATVGSAEERAKLVYSIEHETNASGENPFIKDMAKAINVDKSQDVPSDINGIDLADKVAATTNKQAINLPPGARIKTTDTKSDINFSSFYKPNVESVCSTVQIPPEVALSKYDSNFSASRAALKDWEHTIYTDRDDLVEQFYSRVYELWLELEILSERIKAPGYIDALINKNREVIEAYANCRFIGANVPHIDPVKEVTAERLKLGENGKSVPLTTVEKATEALNGGDYSSNVKQFREELKLYGNDNNQQEND